MSEEGCCCPTVPLLVQLELLLLVLLGLSEREILELFIDAPLQIVARCFGLDHMIYVRWLPIHLCNVCSLNDVVPNVAAQFIKGKFVVNKTSMHFSGIPRDQAHEQNSILVKCEGGAVGLTENLSAPHWLMMSGSEIAKTISEFDASMVTESTEIEQSTKHHEDMRSLQSLFYEDATALTRTIKEMANPFMEETEDLLVLDTKEIMGFRCTGETAQDRRGWDGTV